MGLYEHLPYTNIHNLNEDWILSELKKALEEWAATKSEWAATKSEWASYKKYIDEYFANLDVTEEVRQILHEMLEAGELDGLINQALTDQIPPAVTEWLEANVDPVGSAVMVDSSLSIRGAAADAEKAGEKFGYRAVLSDLNNADSNGFYVIGVSSQVLNIPETMERPCYLLNMLSDTEYSALQILFDKNGSTLFRRKYTIGTVETWTDWGGMEHQENVTETSPYTSFDDIVTAGFYTIYPSSNIVGGPTIYSQPAYLTVHVSGRNVTQYLIDALANVFWRRRYNDGSTDIWKDWLSPQHAENVSNLTVYTSYNDMLNHGLYTIYPGASGLSDGDPAFTFPAYMNVYGAAPNYTQMLITKDGALFWRRRYTGSSGVRWSNWLLINGAAKGTAYYYAFGDSITRGQTQAAQSPVADYNFVQGIADSCGCVLVNKGVSGQGFLKTASGNTALDNIVATDITQANMITIAYGRNDYQYSLGEPTDTTGASTICGQLKACIENIRGRKGEAQIVIIAPTPASGGYDGRTRGGWTLREMETAFKSIAAAYHCAYFDWEDMTMSADFSTYTSDGTHPLNASYKYMAAYMGGQVSKIFRNNTNML